MVLVDTSAWIELLRKDGEPGIKLAMNALLDRDEAKLCGPVLMELLGGTPPEGRRKLSSLLSVIPYHRCHDDLWRKVGESYSLLRSNGVTVPWNDVIVASVSTLASSRVYSPDHHFDLMAPVLGLRLYTPGPGGTYAPESA